MAVVLDPRMRKLYAKMMDCRTVEDLEHFHEQLYYQYGEKQSDTLGQRLIRAAQADVTIHQAAGLNALQQGTLLAQVIITSYQRALRQSTLDSIDERRHSNRTLLIYKHRKDRLKMIAGLDPPAIRRHIRQKVFVSVAKAILAFLDQDKLASYEEKLDNQTLKARMLRSVGRGALSLLGNRDGPTAIYSKYITAHSITFVSVVIDMAADVPQPYPVEAPMLIIDDLLDLALAAQGTAPVRFKWLLALLQTYIATLARMPSNSLTGRDFRFMHGWSDVPWLSQEVNADLLCIQNSWAGGARRSLLRKVLWDMGRSVPGPA